MDFIPFGHGQISEQTIPTLRLAISTCYGGDKEFEALAYGTIREPPPGDCTKMRVLNNCYWIFPYFFTYSQVKKKLLVHQKTNVHKLAEFHSQVIY